MSKIVKLLPTFIDRINDIILANDIVSEITLEEEDGGGIGKIVTMSWCTEHNGYATKMTVAVIDEKDW